MTSIAPRHQRFLHLANTWRTTSNEKIVRRNSVVDRFRIRMRDNVRQSSSTRNSTSERMEDEVRRKTTFVSPPSCEHLEGDARAGYGDGDGDDNGDEQPHSAMEMAMAMSTVQAASVSSLVHSSRLSSSLRQDEAATSSKCSRNDLSTLSRRRTGSCLSLRRSSLRSSAQSARDYGGEHCDCESAGVDRQLRGESCGVERSRWRRRECFLAMAVVGGLVSQERARAEETEVAVDAPALELYVDEKEGFKLLRPSLWNKVEKAGATVLFEDPAKRGNTIGVVVNPVRIASLKDFGTADVVAEKLIAAERKKPSTNDAQLVRVQERLAFGDTPLYSLEYNLDSSRGQKKILSAVTVASKKLYILNITYLDSAAAPAPPAMAEVFEQVLNSFDLLT